MKKYCFVILLSFLALPTFLNAQEEAPREIPVADLMQMHKGEVNKFKGMLERFKAAVNEKDQQSVSVLQKELMDQMTSQVSFNLNMSRSDASNKNWKERYKTENRVYEELKEAKLQVRTNAGMQAALDILKQLDTFASTMEEGLGDIEAYLKTN